MMVDEFVCACVSALASHCMPQHSGPGFHGLGLSVGFHRLCLYSGSESTVLMCYSLNAEAEF